MAMPQKSLITVKDCWKTKRCGFTAPKWVKVKGWRPLQGTVSVFFCVHMQFIQNTKAETAALLAELTHCAHAGFACHFS